MERLYIAGSLFNEAEVNQRMCLLCINCEI